MSHITNEHPKILETTTIHLLSELLIARRIIEILSPLLSKQSFLIMKPDMSHGKKKKQTNRKIKIQLLQKIVRAFIRH